MNSLILIIGAFVLLAGAALYFNFKQKTCVGFILVTYILTFVFTIYQGVFYANNYPGTSPDETAHISYVYYLNSSGEIIPHFENMHLFNTQPMKWSDEDYIYVEDSYNYLCHPPLYYQLMKLAGGFTETDTAGIFHIEKMQLRYFSLLINSLGLLLLLYIGFSRIDKSKPWLHLLFAVTATSIPLMCFEMCAVTNDALSLLTGTICILGLIRFCENNRNALTYALIAAGITSSLLTKMTTAMLCVIMALLVLFITMIKEHSVKDNLRKEFFITSPIYLIALLYFAIIYKRYGVLQPSLELISSSEYIQNTIFYTAEANRVSMNFVEYLTYYLGQFFKSWTGITADVIFAKLTMMDKMALAAELLWIIPAFILIPCIKNTADKLALPIISGYVSIIITFVIQAKSAYGTFLTRGYLGGFNSRYYIPFMAIFALSPVLVFTGANEKIKHGKLIICIVAICYSFMLFMSNYPFYLIYFS